MQSPLSEFRLVQLDGTAGAQTIATASINIAAMDCNVADAVLPLLHHATSTNIGHVRPTRRKIRPSTRPGRQRVRRTINLRTTTRSSTHSLSYGTECLA